MSNICISPCFTSGSVARGSASAQSDWRRLIWRCWRACSSFRSRFAWIATCRPVSMSFGVTYPTRCAAGYGYSDPHTVESGASRLPATVALMLGIALRLDESRQLSGSFSSHGTSKTGTERETETVAKDIAVSGNVVRQCALC